jgi:acetylornithine deacetylase/succinyl-diaminopimelate desuccinylase-like protein
MSPDDLHEFWQVLEELVALDTTTPVSDQGLAEVERVLRPFGCYGVGERLLGGGDPTDRIWMYTHVDTKPPGDLQRWDTDPFRLTADHDRWLGLGVSDSKFQLLNALLVRRAMGGFVLIDTSEESDHHANAQAIIAEASPEALIVCDGTRGDHDAYNGVSGQLDGLIHLETGMPRRHPSQSEGAVLQRLSDLSADVQRRGLRFTVTGLSGLSEERSLSLQEVAVRFDLRFSDEERPRVADFLARWSHSTRQMMWPVQGAEVRTFSIPTSLSPASFSTRLGREEPLGARFVIAVPGSEVDNQTHMPNEFIRPPQILRHWWALSRVVSELTEAHV